MTLEATRVVSDASRFLAVGVTGVAVNVAVTWSCHFVTGDVLASAAIGMLVSVIVNFLLLEHWVFHDRAVGRIWGRFAGFLAIGLIDFLVRAPFLKLLEPVIGIASATIITLSVVFVVRFTVSRHLLWREAPVAGPVESARRDNTVAIDQELAKLIASLPDVLRPAEVARVFGVDPKTVIRWAETGKIKSFRTLGLHHRFRKTDVVAHLDDGTIPQEGSQA